MKLKKLVQGIRGLDLRGDSDVEISSLCNYSKEAKPGALFFAKTGKSSYIQEAVRAGVHAVVTDLFDPFLSKGVVQVLCSDVAALEDQLIKRFYGKMDLWTVGITGTNGKTTSTYIVKHFLDSLGVQTGLIGTVQWIAGKTVLPSKYTTPDLLTNYRLFREMTQEGCQAVVMEVSSHGIAQDRVRSIDFDVALFTNLTQDHLDYHETMDAYAAVKAQLFSGLSKSSSIAVVNVDSPYADLMLSASSVPVLTYGLDKEAALRARCLSFSAEGTRGELCYNNKSYPFFSPLVGRFNVYNMLGALGVCLAKGYTLEDLVPLIPLFSSVPGRLERVDNGGKKSIFVDYAHTEDALQNVLETLKALAPRRLVCVFGCGGDRDRLKRPKMGSVAARLADFVVVTSDNPRSEEPEDIVKEILLGMEETKHVVVELDRKRAIEKAIDLLEPGDLLLIAGKGHEKVQIFRHQTIHFDDRIVAKEYSE